MIAGMSEIGKILRSGRIQLGFWQRQSFDRDLKTEKTGLLGQHHQNMTQTGGAGSHRIHGPLDGRLCPRRKNAWCGYGSRMIPAIFTKRPGVTAVIIYAGGH
jgi:hypothetical protein